MMLKPDIPFSRDDANRFLPWMVALMCAITALMMCVGITLGQWVTQQEGTYATHMTVQVPDIGKGSDALTTKTLELLGQTEGVDQVDVLSKEQVQEMVSPWVGEGKMLDALPYPTVIEVTVVETSEENPGVDIAALKTGLEKLNPAISLDTQEMWVEQFARFSSIVQSAMYILAIFIITGLAGMMIFAARATMKLHANTVKLLHSIGANDTYIARQFQQNAFVLALRGALPGTLIAALVYGTLGFYAAKLDSPLMQSFGLTFLHIFMLMLLPLACAMISVIAVRLATLSQLRMLP